MTIYFTATRFGWLSIPGSRQARAVLFGVFYTKEVAANDE